MAGDQEVGSALEGAVEKHALVDDGDAGGDGVAGLIPRRGQRGQGVLGSFDHPDRSRAEDVDEPLQPAPLVGLTVADQQVVRLGRVDRRAGVVKAHAGRAGMGQRKPVPALERVDDIAGRHDPPRMSTGDAVESLHVPPIRLMPTNPVVVLLDHPASAVRPSCLGRWRLSPAGCRTGWWRSWPAGVNPGRRPAVCRP